MPSGNSTRNYKTPPGYGKAKPNPAWNTPASPAAPKSTSLFQGGGGKSVFSYRTKGSMTNKWGQGTTMTKEELRAAMKAKMKELSAAGYKIPKRGKKKGKKKKIGWHGKVGPGGTNPNLPRPGGTNQNHVY